MQQGQLPYWVQVVQALGPTIVALVVGAIAALLTFWQFKTSRDKLRLELFEKRYVYFVDLRDFMIFVIQHGQPDQERQYEFARKMVGAEFVFSVELTKYIESVRSRSQRLLAIFNFLENIPTGERRNKFVDESSKIFMSISDEFGHLEERFGISMSLGKM